MSLLGLHRRSRHVESVCALARVGVFVCLEMLVGRRHVVVSRRPSARSRIWSGLCWLLMFSCCWGVVTSAGCRSLSGRSERLRVPIARGVPDMPVVCRVYSRQAPPHDQFEAGVELGFPLFVVEAACSPPPARKRAPIPPFRLPNHVLVPVFLRRLHSRVHL